jgi:hypothetical protein
MLKMSVQVGAETKAALGHKMQQKPGIPVATHRAVVPQKQSYVCHSISALLSK